VAAALRVDGGTIKQARIAVGGVAARPLLLTAVEAALAGQPANEETAKVAGQSAAWGARPLNYNRFKVSLLENLVRRAVRGATA